MGKYRKRFNDKARAGMVAKQDALRRARNKRLYQQEDSDDNEPVTNVEDQAPADPNAEMLLPISKAEKEERKKQMAEELNRNAPGMSSKKRKRLDKYIERQLRKQENAELIEKISKNRVETSGMQSLKTLGVGTHQTKRQKLEEAIDLDKKGLADDDTKALLYEEREVKDWRESEEFKDYKEPEPEPEEVKTSSFIDYRPANKAAGFGFSNLPTISKTSRPKYNWRARVAEEDAKKYAKSKDKAMYFAGDDDDDDDDDESDSESQSESDDDDDESDSEGDSASDEEEEEEWTGFSDTELPQESDNDVAEEEEDEEDDEGSDESSGDEPHVAKGRGADFKSWVQSMNGGDERKEGLDVPEFHGEYVPLDRPEDQEEATAEMMIPENSTRTKADYVHVERSEELQTARLQLPVVSEEHRIMEAIHHNDCVVICGETGSGKTTQVPQFLFESGFGSSKATPGMVGVTQPRRVAAVSMANRVSTELAGHGHRVGYQIRFDANVKEDTAIKFMTDGVLLRELSADFSLSKYSVIIIDEAHERNINTDILIGVLSRVMKLRKDMDGGSKPLKLVIMSATLRVADFTENSRLFETPPPVLKVEARQHPVSIHFNKRTHFNYLDQVYDKTVKIHQRLPPGGILIFLTGQNEITGMVKRLRKAFPTTRPNEEENVQVRISAKEATTEVEDVELGLDDEIEIDEEDQDDYEEEEEEGFDEELEDGQDANAPLHVLPLYSLLPTKEQMKVFDDPPPGARLVVVATNVAETSLTIPGIRYVVDCGRSKERHYDEDTGVQSFKIGWTSKASAGQRAGRAGRTGPGHCYRIYSSAVYENDFSQFSKPEIERMPIEGVVLQMKSMGISNIINFPFPSPPPKLALKKGQDLLKYLGALDSRDEITDLGRNMALFPLSPRFAKMLLLGNQHDCLGYIVAIVAGLTVGDPFIAQHELGIDKDSNDSDDETVESKEFKRKLRSKYFKSHSQFSALDGNSDALKLLCAVCAYDYDSSETFTKENFLRHKTMDEIHKLRKQIAYIVAANTKENAITKTTAKLNAKLNPPSKVQVKALKQMVSAGFIDQVGIRAELIADVEKSYRVINFPYAPLFPVADSRDDDPYVYIHPGSVIAQTGDKPPDYVVFAAMSRSGDNKKIRIKPLCDITGAQLANIAKNSALITYSKPLGPPYGPKQISLTKRECWVVPRMGAAIGTGGVGWDLPVVKVTQVKQGSSWIVT